MSEADLLEHAQTQPGARTPADTVEHALRSAIDAHGPEAFYAPDALETFLSRRCPDAGNDIALLRVGLDEQVPQALVGLHSPQDLDSLARELQERLSGQRSLNRYAAAWVVKTWIDALRLRAEAVAPTIPAAAPPAPGAPVVTPASGTTGRPPPTAIPPAARASILPSSTGAARWVRIGVAIVAMIVITIAILFEWRMSPQAPAPADAAASPPEAAMARLDTKPSVLRPPQVGAAVAPAPSTIAPVAAPGPIAANKPPSPTTSASRGVETPPRASAVAPPRASLACTRATCGSVVAVRETGSGTRASGASRPSYEIIVRMDDRAIHTFRQPTMSRAGTRARVIDGKLLVFNSPPPARRPHREGRLVPESEPAVGP